MADGGWRMADGGWRMADGGWRMADGGWRMADRKMRKIKCGWENMYYKMRIENCERLYADDKILLVKINLRCLLLALAKNKSGHLIEFRLGEV